MRSNKYTKRLVVETGFDEEIIKNIIDWSFSEAIIAMKTNDVIEISGFGKFYINKRKMKRYILSYKNYIEEYLKTGKLAKRLSLETAIITVKELIERYEDDQLESDIRRLEEQITSSREPKRED